MNEDEVDAQLDKVVRLLAYISDKDLFNEFYKKKLGRRLLNDNNTQDDAERSALSKLKQQCGTQYTSKVGHTTHGGITNHGETDSPHKYTSSANKTDFWPLFQSHQRAFCDVYFRW